MAQQKAQGTITIIDTNEIERVYPVYCKGGESIAPSLEPLSNWKEEISEITVTGNYIWQRIVTKKYGINVTVQDYSDAVRLTGLDGIDITDISITYCNHAYNDDSHKPIASGSGAGGHSGWQTNVPSYDSSYPYYWVKTTITYSEGNPSVLIHYDAGLSDANAAAALANSIATHSNEMANGAMSQATANIQTITRLWYAKANSIAPAIPTTHITTSSATTYNTWNIKRPNANDSYPYYFYCDETCTGGGVYSWSEVTLDTSTLSQYQIGALTAKVKNFWWDSSGAHVASGKNGNEVTKETISTYGYHALMGLTGISFNYDSVKVVDLNSTTPSLDFYQPPTISGNTVTQGNKTMMLSANALNFYDPTDGTTEQAKLDANGLVLKKGGIQAGSISAGNDGYVYLSTEDYPLETFTKTSDSDIDNSKTYYEYSSANGGYIQVTNPIVSDIDSYYEREGTGLTIGGHTPANAVEDVSNIDPAWRQIIGNKFGVDSEGNLYANDAHLSNANVEGAITATSLKIGSTNSYDGVAAINISGYLIEIISDSTDVNDPEHTTYLYPILYHNGEKVVPEDYSHFLWYEEGFDTATAGDGDNLGRYLATYGHRYRVTYAFDDGAVEGGTITQTLMVDPQKYITKINDYGITIHPEIIASNLGYVQIDGNGLKIKQTISDAININNDITLANYGNTITIGQSNSKNVFIDSNGVNIKNGSTILSNFGETITIGQSENKNVFIDSNGVNIKNGLDTLANFGDTITLGQIDTTHVEIDYHSLKLIDQERESYLYISDLRDIDGYANVHEFCVVDDWFIAYPSYSTMLSTTVSSVYKVTIDDVETSDYTVSSQPGSMNHVTVEITAPLTVGSKIAIFYRSNDIRAKAFTLGKRNFYVPGSTAPYSFAMGYEVMAEGTYSHAEGHYAKAFGIGSHAEGWDTEARGDDSHAEGLLSKAIGPNAHAEGQHTIASGVASHAEGSGSEARGDYSHASGLSTVANKSFQTAIGAYNIIDTYTETSGADKGQYAFIIGNGGSGGVRSNALTVDWDGQVQCLGVSSKNNDYKEIFLGDYSNRAKQIDSSLTTSSADNLWLTAALKAICADYPGYQFTIFKGRLAPNSQGWFEIFIYNTSATSSGLPQYATGSWHKWQSVFWIISTNNYAFNYVAK